MAYTQAVFRDACGDSRLGKPITGARVAEQAVDVVEVASLIANGFSRRSGGLRVKRRP
jgi:hypothetical protein